MASHSAHLRSAIGFFPVMSADHMERSCYPLLAGLQSITDAYALAVDAKCLLP
jgi:hypothetical protein